MLQIEPGLINNVGAGQSPCMVDATSSRRGCVPVGCQQGPGSKPRFFISERVAPAFAVLHMVAVNLPLELVTSIGTSIRVPF